MSGVCRLIVNPLGLSLLSTFASEQVHYDKRLLAELCSLRFVAEHRNLVVLGPVGVGKTYWSTALSHLCCRAGYHVRFSRADALLRSLRQSRMDNSREALMTALCTVDVLVLDDFALEPMGREESRDIYQLFVERKRSMFGLDTTTS